MCADRRRVGILGGTFDPVHLGHLASAAEIAEAFSLETVLLVLSARPPHKPTGEAAPAEHRWRMLELAAADPEATRGPARIEPCDIELRRATPSWTVDTLKEILASSPNGRPELFLVLGADAYAEIDTWSRPEELLRLANIVVTTRPGWTDARHDVHAAPLPPVAARQDCRYDPSIGGYVHTSGHAIHGHRIRGLEVSSSEIRSRVRAGLPVDHLTGDAVARYIREHELYAGDRTPRPAAGVSRTTGGAGKD